MKVKKLCEDILPEPLYMLIRNVHTNIYKCYVKYCYRNLHDINGKLCEANKVHLEYWNGAPNIGDQLAPVIFRYVMKAKELNPNVKVRKIRHLLTIGSLLDGNHADAVVWGSGILGIEGIRRLADRKKYMKYDIRAVRGPISREILESMGYICPQIYGDPGILMPLIYDPKIKSDKKYRVSVIYSYSTPEKEKTKEYHTIDIRTSDYEKVIDEIIASEQIISESLHGIILAETYGIPAILLRKKGVDAFPLKYYDWYYSTKRYTVKAAATIEEAMGAEPMPLPELSGMRQQLLDCFPMDIFIKE